MHFCVLRGMPPEKILRHKLSGIRILEVLKTES